MIITRTPLRISLGGGGTDLKSYYQHFGSFFISAAIDKYVYIAAHPTFKDEIVVKYSQFEKVKRVTEIQHDIVRQSLKMHDIESHIELSSMADIPAGTGLGSSGSFGVGLLKALHTFKRTHTTPQNLAESACSIEIDQLKRNIGKQDQYIAAFGGVTCFEIDKTGHVTVYPLRMSNETLRELEDNLLLFFTGYSHDASEILKEQDEKSKKSDKEMVQNLHFIKKLGIQSKEALEAGDLGEFARLMNVHWEHKKKRSGNMSNKEIDELYEYALQHGALGGKLIGAGGGGFLMFYAKDKQQLIKAMAQKGYSETRFAFDFEGSKVIINN